MTEERICNLTFFDPPVAAPLDISVWTKLDLSMNAPIAATPKSFVSHLQAVAKNRCW